MARLRTVKVEYWQDEQFATALPGPDGREARRFFIGLWNVAEDHGVFRANPVWLKGQLYPYDDDVTVADVERWLGLLKAGGFIVRYEHRGQALGWVRNFHKHQTINRPSATVLPLPSADSLRTHGVLSEPSQQVRNAASEHSLQPPDTPNEHSVPEGIRSEASTKRSEGENAPAHVAPAAVPQGQATAPPADTPALVDQLLDAWRQKRGKPYAFRARRDDPAVMDALSQAGGDWAEVVRRWRLALARERFPVCNSLADLARHWNAYAVPEAQPKPKGRTRAQDVDWKAHEENPPDAPF